MNDLDPELLAALRRAAAAPTVVVACDFDGTLAPLVDEPMTARALPTAVEAFTVLARLPRTHAALVSGRSLADLDWLARTSNLPDDVERIGSHGWEHPGPSAAGGAPATASPIDDEQRERHARLAAAAQDVAAIAAGVRVEIKPASVTVHYRMVRPEDLPAVLAAIDAGPGSVPGCFMLNGSDVVEFAVVRVDKGVALERLRARTGADALCFVGDDVTDEHGFAVLGARDVGIKVGDGDTAARWRVADPAGASEALLALAAARAAHVRE